MIEYLECLLGASKLAALRCVHDGYVNPWISQEARALNSPHRDTDRAPCNTCTRSVPKQRWPGTDLSCFEGNLCTEQEQRQLDLWGGVRSY